MAVDRRGFLSAVACLGALAAPSSAAFGQAEEAEPFINDDGLYTQPWFLETFLELRDDLEEAAGEGKRLAVMWEQRGCPYCKETHLVNFADPEIRAFVSENFAILQLNMFGSRKVTDFDGEELEERALARKAGIRFSPTIQFFPTELAAADEGKSAKELEVARMPGYLRPAHFLSMFRFVQEQAYESESFRAYLKRQTS